jgi:hypothetical protein
MTLFGRPSRSRALLLVAVGLASLAAATTLGATTTTQMILGTVGQRAISLRTLEGQKVTLLKPGKYRILVRDRSARENFHLSGPGINRRTAIRFVGSSSWAVRLGAGTYRYRSDAHPVRLHGSLRVR